MCYTKNRVTVKIFNRTGGKIMADMKLHVEMLNGLSEDVRACVEQARERVDTYEQEISNVSSEQVASKAEKKSIKQSFSLKRWIRSKFFGISAEEATANMQLLLTRSQMRIGGWKMQRCH